MMTFKRKLPRINMVMWIVLCVFTFLFYCLEDEAWNMYGVYWEYTYIIMALTFPLGFFVNLAMQFLDIGYLLNEYAGSNITIITLWFITFLAGFFQWFVIIPRIYRGGAVKTKKNLSSFIMIVWIVLCVYVFLSYYLYLAAWKEVGYDSEVGLLFALKMLTLTFPLGYIVGLIVSLFLDLYELYIKGLSFISIVVISWFAMFIAGFFQWFVIVPRMYRWFCQRYSKKITNLFHRLILYGSRLRGS